MRQLICYDLDGTLVDTLEDIAQAANHMLRELQVPPLPVHEIRRSIGKGLHELVTHCLKTEDPQRIEQGTRIYRAYYTQHLLDHSRLYAGTQALFDHFSTRRQVVITNKPNPYSRQILESLGVAHYFCEIVAGNSAYPKKPHPAALLALMEREQVHPMDTIFIGDSPVDIETGRSAGVVTIGVLHGFSDAQELITAHPDVLVENFAQLLELAQRHGW